MNGIAVDKNDVLACERIFRIIDGYGNSSVQDHQKLNTSVPVIINGTQLVHEDFKGNIRRELYYLVTLFKIHDKTSYKKKCTLFAPNLRIYQMFFPVKAKKVQKLMC